MEEDVEVGRLVGELAAHVGVAFGEIIPGCDRRLQAVDFGIVGTLGEAELLDVGTRQVALAERLLDLVVVAMQLGQAIAGVGRSTAATCTAII